MKKLLYYSMVILCLFMTNRGSAQCDDSEICNSNTGLYSNDDAQTIAYDNMGSGFHSTFIREPNGGWRVWGERINNNGISNVLSPINFNVTNYPALTGTIYKMGIGSDYIDYVQLLVLTSTGLFALGTEGTVLNSAITSSSTFQKITVNGKTDGLPAGVGPADVKMLFVTTQTVMITTCTGEVYVLSQNTNIRGNGGGGSMGQWSKVMVSATQPLTDIIAARGNSLVGYALKSDGTLWTWGDNCFLGDGTAQSIRAYATQMTLPAGLPGIKSIQATLDSGVTSYYILGTDKKVYSLGYNYSGQLGDRTTTIRLSWVNAKNPNNTIITDAAWISANEHDANYSGLAVIKTGGVLYTAGYNSSYMVGRTSSSGTNYLDLPTGVVTTDVITYAEVGGHTCALIKQGSPRYGYVGHRINGSMGDGSATSGVESTYDFITPPIVAVCGTLCVQPILTSNSPICPGQNAVFTITGTPGDIVSYKINGGATQTVIIGAGGSSTVTITAASVPQTITLVYVLGGTGSCSNNLSTSATVTLNGNAAPIFEQPASICEGQPLNPLPTTSQNGIAGTWSPAINNMATTTYTFTPSTTSSCTGTTTITIVVTPSGTVPTFTQIGPVCEGTAIAPLPLASLEGVTGTWSPAINNMATTTYTFTPTAGNCLGTAQMTIEVTPKETPQFIQVNDICQGATLNSLPTTSINGISGTWLPATMDNQHTTTYTFTPNAGVCAYTTTMTIVVKTIVTPTFTQIPAICEGEVLSPLPTTSINNIQGSWAPAINNMATTQYSFTPAANSCANPGNMTITVKQKVLPTFTQVPTLCYGTSLFALPTVSNNVVGITGTWSPAIDNTQTTNYVFTPGLLECAYTAQMQIGVYPDFDFTYDGYCQNGEYNLQILPLNNSFSISTATFDWEINNITVSTNAIFNMTSYLNSTTEIETLPIPLMIKVTNANGCEKTQTVLIDNVYCGVQKGISVNEDGKNDYFDLRLLRVKKLNIFNRYGMVVYSKSDYYNEWKGQSDSGQQLPDGVYYYVIDLEREPAKTGWIYLNREAK